MITAREERRVPVVRLRPVAASDSAALYSWRMEPSTRVNFRSSEPVPFAVHEQFVARQLGGATGDLWFVIEADGDPVGAIALYDRSADGAEAEWGRFVIARDQRRRGIGRAALAALVGRARALGVRRLRCEVLEGNSAEHLYREFGFVAVGEDTVDGRRFIRMVAELEP